MSKTALVQIKASRPIIKECNECNWKKPCGGLRDFNSLFGNSCFERHCCGGRVGCNYLCPSNRNFTRMLNEVMALKFHRLPELIQPPVRLPAYVPSILHHSRRERPLVASVVAVPVEEVLHTKGRRMRAVAQTAAELRRHLVLSPTTKIVLNCVRKDDPIERLWEHWIEDKVPQQLAALRISAVIAPNYSYLKNVPRLESVGNRMRQLICARDMHQAGLTVIPHLSVLEPHDWEFWQEWLLKNPTARAVAFEFETGYKNPVDGRDAIRRLAAVQAAIGRDLHFVVVGGTQFTCEVASRFRLRTFIDGSPFWNTIQRQKARLSGGQLAWSRNPTDEDELLDDLLEHNLDEYWKWMLLKVTG